LERSKVCTFFGVIGPGVAGNGTSCLVVILLNPLIACPMLSLLLRRAEKDFFLCIAGLAARGSETMSSAGGVGRDGNAVMVLPAPAIDAEELCDVGGRVIELRLFKLLNAAGFLIMDATSDAGMLAVEGLLM
jgi:hypothetical protein